MQNQHFKTDDREDRDSRDQRERSPREQRVRKKPRENKAPAGLDEDEEIRIAIELSKQTAKKEEKDRMKEAKVASKTNIRENN